jgi:hypothetical protein
MTMKQNQIQRKKANKKSIKEINLDNFILIAFVITI